MKDENYFTLLADTCLYNPARYLQFLQRATLKAGMTERRNDGMAESRNGGKLPQILKDGIAESIEMSLNNA